METYFALGVVAIVLLLVARTARAWWGRQSSSTGAAAAETRDTPSSSGNLYELADSFRRDVAHPSELLNDDAFKAGLAILSRPDYSIADVAGYATGDNAALACIALEALTRRPATPELVAKLIHEAGLVSSYVRFFICRALAHHAPAGEPIVADLLVELTHDPRMPPPPPNSAELDSLRSFVEGRLERGENPAVSKDRLERLDEAAVGRLLTLIGLVGLQPLGAVGAQVRESLRTRVNRTYLATIGRIWDDARAPGEHAILSHAALDNQVGELASVIGAEPPRSALIVGEPGVGKTAVAHAFLRRMQQGGWTVFEAGTTELLAGQIYVGALEQRLQQLVHELHARRRVIWYIPDFPNLGWVGRHQFSPVSAFDFLLPFVERGELVVLGECRSQGFERLTQTNPRCLTALRAVRLMSLSDEATLDLASRWAAATGRPDAPSASEGVLDEAWRLAQQYLGDRAAPGNLLHLLRLTRERLEARDELETTAPVAISVDDLIVTLARLTGLPETILDDRRGLDLDELRRLFESRVMQQPEAVDCLVERVAMIKAGVTDPGRPFGVFLFAGPTGTGKTEIAKTLAKFLFGDSQRMIRLDMSEMQTPESLARILGEPGDDPRGERSLVRSIREQPFSVLLLDEFEKAHPNVWDLFLQVFDDGRLTDRRGAVADFRHAIIVLTSNLGAAIPTGTSPGFTSTGQGFRPELVTRAVERAFRREFVNRLDRIIVFRPLKRETMRDILRRELDEVLLRRGLRNRDWAVEWDDAAIEFLLERGFTHDLGARPLKRAIERYFLSPLATTIVRHQAPKGDQFLFVRTDGDRLKVVFVDPDASPDAPPAETPAARVLSSAVPRIEAIALHPVGSLAEVDCVRSYYERLRDGLQQSDWQDAGRALLSRMSEPEFWSRPDRFGVLGEIEYRDRIASGVERCGSLLARLVGRTPGTRSSYPRDVLERLAQQLILLGVACEDVEQNRPRDAFLRIEAAQGAANAAFGERLSGMYREWARRRGMQVEPLDETRDARHGYRCLFAFSGYGSHTLLAPEAGLHVLEVPIEASPHTYHRHRVRVRVAPQPDTPVGSDDRARRLRALQIQAHRALEQEPDEVLRIVRRYREHPSPLARDSVRGWRTGRVDLVLAGNFDLLAGVEGGVADPSRHVPD